MSADIVARALALQARPLAPTAQGLASQRIPASVERIETSGYAAPGKGAGSYVSDSLADAALAAAHPRFCKADAGGRYWRLLPDDRGLIPVACGGALGQDTPVTDASVDDRPAIQAAEDYRHAIGAAGIRFDARYYAVRRRVPSNITDIPAAMPDGTMFYSASSTIWLSTCGTELHRRNPNGTAMTLNSFTLLTSDWGGFGRVWRGGVANHRTGVDPAQLQAHGGGSCREPGLRRCGLLRGIVRPGGSGHSGCAVGR